MAPNQGRFRISSFPEILPSSESMVLPSSNGERLPFGTALAKYVLAATDSIDCQNRHRLSLQCLLVGTGHGDHTGDVDDKAAGGGCCGSTSAL